MASIPHFYSDYQFSPQEFSDITSMIAQQHSMLGHELNVLPFLYDNNGGLEGFQVDSDILSRVPMMTTTTTTATSFPEQLGFSEVVVPSLLDYRMGFSDIPNIQNFGGGFQYSDACECGESCSGFVPSFKSVCPNSRENWGIQCNQMPAMEHTNMKVGRYTAEERKDRILRYLKKRNQRNFNKTIKYACRKTLADRRVRVRGRFARNNELCEDEKIDNPLQEKESYSNDTLEMKNDDDDDWLQEAVASLMYVPYIAG
ncbi:uncharacterized protein LOC110600443 [Manihot esculenta]|uniref:CCT domain-containing protein n=1 Tax=Manihot esculenta TaxID=3983 RepID=A0A2C9UIV6_MANES|nr:uncharacterized protein LOC110600443 [Manihot esculenta]OAY30196.1 hypothetical protein MANES_14G012100v8 [Manihot esculenta]